jgi:hypothetical protein
LFSIVFELREKERTYLTLFFLSLCKLLKCLLGLFLWLGLPADLRGASFKQLDLLSFLASRGVEEGKRGWHILVLVTSEVNEGVLLECLLLLFLKTLRHSLSHLLAFV